MAQDGMHPFVKTVRKEVIATGGRGCWVAITGYTRNKFECLCQIFSVYTSNTASFFSHYYHVCDFAPALILASLLCLGKKQVWHSYCTEVLSSLREWVCNDAATRAQKSGHVPAQSKVCLEALALKNICKQYRCPHGDGFSGLDLSHVENQLCVDVLP